jgi:hypothetical protein
MMRPWHLALAVGLLPLATGLSIAQPDRPARLVVRGRVAAAEARWDATRTLFTYLTIDVTGVVVGANVPAQLVIKQLGGEVAGIGLWVSGQAAFAANEDVLLDLAARADGTLQTADLARGKWRVETDPATGRLEAVQTDGSGNETRAPLALVESRLAATRTPLTAFAARPPEIAGVMRAPGPLFSFLPTDGGPPPRWHEVDDDAAVFADIAPIPGTWTHASGSHVSAAVNLWRNSGMELDLRQGGSFPSGQCPAAFTGNGRIAVAFNDPCGITDWSIGGGYYTVGDLRTVNGTTFQKFLQGLVVLDDSGPQTSAAGCFQDAITHGLGHALGLGHTNSGGAIMNAAPPSGCASGPSGLGADDVSGVTTIYRGIASTPNPPDTPTNFTVAAQLNTAIFSWAPASTGGAAQRFLIDAGTASGVYNLGTLTVNAPATSTAVGGVPPGTYFLRIRAQNVLGTSAPSAERSVTVGSCTVPGPPASLTGVANDQLVGLQWTPPSSGIVQGYRLAAGTAPGLSNIAVLDFAATQTSLGGTVPYGTYFLRVHATNVCGISAPSPELTLAVQPCTAAPNAPTGLMGSVSGGNVSLAWSAPASGPAPTTYVLYAGSLPGASDITIYNTGTTATSIGAPAPKGTYYVRAAAGNACGQSAVSNEVVIIVP